MKSIGIIGAGLMGRVVAINAINNGYQTTLFEKKDLSILDSASRTAAGMISPIAEVENESPKFYEWGKYSLSRWSDICSNSSPLRFEGGAIGSTSFFRRKLLWLEWESP